MNKISLISFEWTCYNGIYFDILQVDMHTPFFSDTALFGFNISKSFFYIDILFVNIKIFDKIK
jgi:hypothetical protein